MPVPAADLDLAGLVRPGDRILFGQATGEPRALTAALVEQRGGLGGVEAFLGVMLSDTFQPQHADAITFRALGGFGANARLSRAGVLDVVPCHISAVPGLIADGTIGADVVFVQLSPPDSAGRHSLGPVADYLRPALERARVVVGEVNEHVPWTCGDTVVEAGRLDRVVRSTHPPLEVPAPELGEAERRVAEHVAERVPDGAVLQLGIGSIPEAVCGALGKRRDLGVHSGMITDGVAELMEAGVITNRRKPIDPGETVTGVLLGGRRLLQFAHRNPAIQMRPATYTHGAAVLARLERLVSINTAVEVDLTGQVNAEVAGGFHLGAVGGAVDYVRGAVASAGGTAIIALPATARGGSVSRIVGRLGDGVTSTARSDTDLVVTEYGVAELRGRSLRERACSLIRIAHPDFRAGLEEAAERLC
ncbi:MAG TPA: acetyl-CoA hydrolase/transferase C-terminal domain-containing protein [Candidatus Binatia bacterium]|nr:acetyl-CoA hydrolase/transferase C-terminal domain-containing protein [Candidatus Binatia bacterium]